jgi:hypothetical protein
MPATRKTAASTTDGAAGHVEMSDRDTMQLMMLKMQENSMRIQEQQVAMQQQMQVQMAQMTQLTSGMLSRSGEQAPVTRARRPERPVIAMESTDTDWIMFTEDWGRYKQMSVLVTNEDIRNELRASCSKEVN